MSELSNVSEPAAPALADGSDRHMFPPLGRAINVLMIWPRFLPSFWSFEGMMGIFSKENDQPPLGLLTIAALCPAHWQIRLNDRTYKSITDLDADILWANLVMVGGMRVQKDDIREILLRARTLGRRTMIGGPYASSEPETLLSLADHVVVGEPDEMFDSIVGDLERGSAQRLYVIHDKPDVSKTPVPRFDLLDMDKYVSMAVQFSRGCPFQCEFCDIITIYGRRPRTKPPDQLIAELNRMFELGWRGLVFIVDDNFIGNHKRALELARDLELWQQSHGYPFLLYTEASIDLAQRVELIDAMVKANFFWVFVGIESPSKESLIEAKKFQNLRHDPLESIRFIQKRGLWVTAGFIIGFDSDTEEIFEQQRDFIERAAIPWAMAGFLQAPPTTPLHDRMSKSGRLITESDWNGNFDPPNFRTRIPLPILVRGLRDTLLSLYSPSTFYDRAYRSLVRWETREQQKAPPYPLSVTLGILGRSIWRQGIRSSYRSAYWKFMFQVFARWSRNTPKLSMAIMLLVSGHHFIPYARTVADRLEAELRKLDADETASGEGLSRAELRGTRATPLFNDDQHSDLIPVEYSPVENNTSEKKATWG